MCIECVWMSCTLNKKFYYQQLCTIISVRVLPSMHTFAVNGNALDHMVDFDQVMHLSAGNYQFAAGY